MDKKLIVTGIIVEYNPLHNGHIYHIEKAKEITQCDVLIAVMSPNFVQRGEPAFIDKFQRTKAALDAGVDIIIELPTYYALQSAEHFANAAITLLQLMKIENLVYGIEDLKLKSMTFDSAVMSKGQSYASAFGPHSANLPNAILAMEYEKRIVHTGINGIRIQRTNDYFATDINSPISSATAIRLAHSREMNTSHTTPMTFSNTHALEDYSELISYALISQTAKQLQRYLLVDEGIENLLKKHQNLELSKLIETCISSRYTRSRIQRTLLNILLGHEKDNPPSLDQVRVLGFNNQGQKYLKQLKNDAVNVTTSFKKYINRDFEMKATQIYNLPQTKSVQEKQIKLELTTPIRSLKI